VIEFIRWRVRLMLVSYKDRVSTRERQLTYQYATYGWRWRWLRDLVDNVVSPFDPWRGYRRRPLRSLLWKVTHPLVTERLASLRWVLKVLDHIAAEYGPGRYEQMDPATRLKVEWLDANSELSSETTGESEMFGQWMAAYIDLDVPWSRQPENWILATSHMGFVSAAFYEDESDLWSDFGKVQQEYERWLIFGGDGNPEGDPTLNGAFA
jgi:hypothetical protein